MTAARSPRYPLYGGVTHQTLDEGAELRQAIDAIRRLQTQFDLRSRRSN